MAEDDGPGLAVQEAAQDMHDNIQVVPKVLPAITTTRVLGALRGARAR
jgi:hypothetical protein